MNSIDYQYYKANEKIIIFNNCKEPEWFKSYKDWIYKYSKVKSFDYLKKLSIKNLQSSYYAFIDKIIPQNMLFQIAELCQNQNSPKDIFYSGIIFQRIKDENKMGNNER